MNCIPEVKTLRETGGFFEITDKGVTIVAADDVEGRLSHAIKDLEADIAKLTDSGMLVSHTRAADRGAIKLSFRDESSDAESYRLSIGMNGISIDGQGPAGLFRGIQTLRQLVRLHGTGLPCLEISDSPDFMQRSFSHDVTRGKVPTLATLKLLADKLAFYKVNQLQLYVEHSFAFPRIPELWKGRDPLIPEEIRELDRYCRDRFIDLVPSLATFGHLYELLRLKRFEHLNELDIKASGLPHSLWDRMAHYTIDVSQEESYSLIKSMIDDFIPLFSSRYCNICCDETFDLGKGKNRRCAEAAGNGRLYIDFVKKIMKAVRSHGKTPMMWGDVMLHYPELINELPPDTVFLNWDYRADATPDACRTFASKGVKQIVCPGVQGWSRFANDVNGASENIRRMVRYGRQNGAIGVCTTDWGDCGHVNFLANSWHGMALGAALSWNVSSYPENGQFDAALSAMEWGDRTGTVAGLLRELGSFAGFYHFGNLYAWAYGIKGTWDREKEVQSADHSVLARSFSRADEIIDALEGLKTCSGDPQDMDEFICSARAVRWTLALLSFKKRNEYGQKECPVLYGSLKSLLEKGEQLLGEFELLWRKRNKESELRNVTETFKKIFSRIKELPDG